MSYLGFRDLNAEDIEVRVAQITDKSVSLLLYKDARCDMRILDEAIGAENWQREHYEAKGRLFCRVGIKCGEEWVWKADCGTESMTEAEKGESSDSFKRACFNWGIGRELYTSPRIYVPSSMLNIKKNGKGKLVCYDKFFVSEIVIEDKRITKLEIMAGEKVVYPVNQPKNTPKKQPTEKPVDKALAAAKTRLWEAVKFYAEQTGSDAKKMAGGVKKRPEFEETADYYNMVAEEFENGL